MKELSIEEKAKRYDEAIERAKEINREHSRLGFKPSDDVLCIFPELKESEDERITAEWSEEDERMYNSALWHIKNSCSNGGKNSGEHEVYHWLKAIKVRVQRQNMWINKN